MIKRLLRTLRAWVNFYPAIHFSQDGEDIVLQQIFTGRRDGFYVDIGAFHPTLYSNTYWFYLSGWRGINIDARPGAMKAFRKWRSRDINLETAIGAQAGALTYYRLNQPAMNSFDAALTQQRLADDTSLRLLEEISMPVRSLSSVLDQHLPPGQTIDFMSIDVEGLDMQVLHSNDFDRYRPDYILVEMHGEFLDEVGTSEIGSFLQSKNYEPIAKMIRTAIFKRRG